MPIKAILFDRDGTLNDMRRAGQDDLYYVLTPEDLKLFPGVVEGLAWLRGKKITPFVFTQQNGIGKGLLTEEMLQKIHGEMQTLLGEAGRIEKFYYATAHDDSVAKPGPGMVQALMAEYGYGPDEVLCVGDSVRDAQAAEAAGVRFVYVDHTARFDVFLKNLLATIDEL